MKFLSKHLDSPILIDGLVYGHDSIKNKGLRQALLKEQHGFCAYTERVVLPTDTIEVEHFDPSLKYNDDYFNYYSVFPWANRAKLKKSYTGTLFFQNPDTLFSRMVYEDGEFRAKSDEDDEVLGLIDFLGFNDEELFTQRQEHVRRLKEILDSLFDLDKEEFLAYLKRHRQELSFPTAIEAEFQIDLTEILKNP